MGKKRGYFEGIKNGNTYIVIKEDNYYSWATYNGIGGKAIVSGKALSRNKAEEAARSTL